MKKLVTLLLVLCLSAALLAQRPWTQLTNPSAAEVAATFKSPPHEYGVIQPFQSWNGADPAEVRARITRDLDRLAANGVFIVNLSPGRRVPGEGKYLSPEHMAQFKFTVDEAAKRNMRLWIQDESDYPSGFAGGYISERFPQLGMQDIVADITVHVQPGQTLTMPVPADTLGIQAIETDASQQVKQVIPIPVPADLKLKYQVPAEGTTPNEPRYTWEVQFVRHVFLSSPTRNFNRADGTRAKDGTYSIIDYLDPAATRAFLHTVHETYFNAAGDQFGKTVLGFFGDEPDYSSGIPWTPNLLADFKTAKGYDLAPYIPQWFGRKPTPQSNLAKADYYDVWSGIFRSSFFGEQAQWASAHNVEYLVHLNHEETMLALERSEGDYFRDERFVQVPGIDNLGQLIPSLVHRPDGTWNINNNFPKLASSSAHLFGRPQVWSEEGGGTGIDGKYQIDFQLVRGVNALEIRLPILRNNFGPAPAPPDTAPAPPAPPQAALIAAYANRGGYLMVIGRPAAQVALYHPGNSIWLGGDDAAEADRSTTKLGWQLFEHQVDWDYFDEQSLTSVATLDHGGFTNLSGQTYKAVVLPSMSVITRTGLDRLRTFARQGGKVIFAGKTPSLVLDRTFLDAHEQPDLSFATLLEPSGDITPSVLAALPAPDLKVDRPFTRLTYTHRRWADADLYFLFNESDQPESRTLSLAGHGTPQLWDLATGDIHPLAPATPDTLALTFAPYEAKVIVLGPVPRSASAPQPSFTSGTPVAALDSPWSLTLNSKQLSTPLKSWQDLGVTASTGPATYTQHFTAAPIPHGRRVFLELGEVHDYASVRINGKDLGARGFQPYRWDVTDALRKGPNDLQITVQSLPEARSNFGGSPPAAASAGPSAAPGTPGTAARRRPQSAASQSAAPQPTLATAPAPPPPATSGLLGPVRLVAY